MRLVRVAACNLDQWAMDFDGNVRRTCESIRAAREQGAKYRLGPELELCGYGCEDHFLERDTTQHSWECLAEVLRSNVSEGIVSDIGMPVEHRGVRYNCRAFVLGQRVLLVRPKLDLANDGNYRETRWFATWKHRGVVEELALPPCIADVAGQETVPFGDALLRFSDALVGSETCEELFTPSAPHIGMSLSGVEIVGNGSGSHHELRKLSTRISLIQSATAKAGGVYLYANQRGCDGGRLYYDGCALIVVNGQVVAQGSQFSLSEVEVITATVDLDDVASYRGAIASLREQASATSPLPSLPCPFRLALAPHRAPAFPPSKAFEPRVPRPEEEIASGPACWLWDYLRRSGASGFLLPLSGGADSSSVAAIVGNMCQLAVQGVRDGVPGVREAVLQLGAYEEGEEPKDAQEFAQRILHTIYMGTENSSEGTRKRAAALASEIGAWHLDVKIDSVVSSLVSLFTLVTGKRPKFRVDGGSHAENLALQNIQARSRMVVAFLMAQLLPWCRGRRNGGFLLVLGSSNVDEALRGYLTKYDCSSADINPIGGISKTDLRRFLKWAAVHLGYASLADVEAAPPTAELEPIRSNYTQLDEVDMGMTYAELSLYGRLRKVLRCGPVSMFLHLCYEWAGSLSPLQVASKVKDFFRFYSMNRHKLTTLTPSYHAESYSPEDNRFDLRQFLYNTRWTWQFACIDRLASGMPPKQEQQQRSDAPSVTTAARADGI